MSDQLLKQLLLEIRLEVDFGQKLFTHKSLESFWQIRSRKTYSASGLVFNPSSGSLGSSRYSFFKLN